MIKRLLLVILLFGSVVVHWAWSRYQYALTAPVITKDGLYFEINRGAAFGQIVSKLNKEQVAIDPFWFKIIAYQQKHTQDIKAGEYALQKGMTMPDLLALFVSGKTRQYSVTIPEGWNFKQIKQLLRDNPYLKHTLESVEDGVIMSQLESQYNHPEGLFFPETYFFEKNSSDFDLLKRAYDKMQLVLKEAWEHRQQDIPIKNSYEALILASIIEKETAVGEERQQIAGVFSRRLQKGMLLQTDPTVIYGMGDHYQGNIRHKDLKQATPYNTYVIKGLPPTPIAMPGKEAIHAALHPAEGKSLYFVARGDGSHEFSSSLRAHNNAVNKFQKKRR
jgi:peptidoglycan lytic transglycosylase G